MCVSRNLNKLYLCNVTLARCQRRSRWSGICSLFWHPRIQLSLKKTTKRCFSKNRPAYHNTAKAIPNGCFDGAHHAENVCSTMILEKLALGLLVHSNAYLKWYGDPSDPKSSSTHCLLKKKRWSQDEKRLTIEIISSVYSILKDISYFLRSWSLCECVSVYFLFFFCCIK